jgi:hypothetical protein
MTKIHIDTVQSEDALRHDFVVSPASSQNATGRLMSQPSAFGSYVRNESSLQTSTRTMDEMEANVNIPPVNLRNISRDSPLRSREATSTQRGQLLRDPTEQSSSLRSDSSLNIIPNAIMIGDCSDNCIVYLEPHSICAFDSVIQTSRTTIYEGNTNDTSGEVNGVILENRIANIIEELYRDDSSVQNRKNICMIIIFVLSIVGLFIFGFYTVLHK